jgi:hypothetical protein
MMPLICGLRQLDLCNPAVSHWHVSFMMRLTGEEGVCKPPVLRVKSTLFHGVAFSYRF